MNIIRFRAGDTLHMKKAHPCGSDRLTVLRVGSDVRVKCPGCGRDMTLPRVKLEKSIRRVESAADPTDPISPSEPEVSANPFDKKES